MGLCSRLKERHEKYKYNVEPIWATVSRSTVTAD